MLYLLEDMAVLRFAGVDVRPFLQGQLSNDVMLLQEGALLRAGLHNPQGRTVALLALLAHGEEVYAVLPAELAASAAALLRRYVLRAKVTINEAPLRVVGLPAGTVAPGPIVTSGRYQDARTLALVETAGSADGPRSQWRALDLAAGLPQVYAATSGQFVAQMLNLDCIDAISFSKGCYTGQEVIARAHYRGRVKRRMQRFLSDTPTALAAGASGRLADGRAFRVVDSVQREDGRCEFLAVAALAGTASSEAEATDNESGTILTASSTLPLPYTLPE